MSTALSVSFQGAAAVSAAWASVGSGQLEPARTGRSHHHLARPRLDRGGFHGCTSVHGAAACGAQMQDATMPAPCFTPAAKQRLADTEGQVADPFVSLDRSPGVPYVLCLH